MTETPVTVDAADLHTLICGFAQADQSFRPFLGTLPGHEEARGACTRLASALVTLGMPPDPVSGADTSAISTSEMLAAYERAGFTRDEAFQLTLAWVQATAGATMRQAMGGGA